MPAVKTIDADLAIRLPGMRAANERRHVRGKTARATQAEVDEAILKRLKNINRHLWA